MSESTESDSQDAPAGLEDRAGADQIRGWSGHRLDEIAGANVGKVEGLFVDADSESPEWLLARMGRFGHHTLIPARDAVEGIRRVWVPYTRDQIRQAPKVDPAEALTATAERAMLAHYEIAGDAGRAAELGERDPDAITARPGQ